MKTAELNEEPPIPPAYEHIRKEQPNHSMKKVTFDLQQTHRELRKKEARKPLYLARYE